MIAHFMAAYPGAYRDTSYPTRDGIIPAARFDVLFSRIESVGAAKQLHATDAAALGARLGFSGEDSNTKRYRRELLRRAYPTVLEDDE